MADFNPVNYVGFQDPSAAIKLQQQQVLAAQLMADSQPRKDMNDVIGSGPYARVAPVSSLEGLSKGLEKGLGFYEQYNANEKLADALGGPKVQSASQSPDGQAGLPLLPWQDKSQAARMGVPGAPSDPSQPTMQERLAESLQPGMGKAMLEARLKSQYAGATKAAETANTPYQTPQGTYEMGSKIMGAPAPANNITSPLQSTAPVGTPNMSPADKNAAITELYGDTDTSPMSPEGKGGAVVLGSDNKQFISADNKPVLSDIPSDYIAPKRSIGDYGASNTNTGVDAEKKLFDNDQKAHEFLSSNAASTREGNARLSELTDIFTKAQSGSAAALFPDLAKRYAAITGSEPTDLGQLQAASGTALMSNLNAIKEANANQEGAPIRTFGSEITHAMDEYLSNKSQPDALWKLTTQMQGINNYKLAMANDYEKIGGTGNALLNGKTMPLATFANKWQASHSMNDFINKQRDITPPFKGMAGNNSTTPAVPQIGFISKGHKFLGGDPSNPQSWEKIP